MNTSINRYFETLAAAHRPRHRFEGASRESFEQWRQALRPALLATLGHMPAKVPPQATIECEWEEDGLVKQRLLIAVEEGLAATAYIFRPKDRPGRLPAILACHGHGPFGKESVMGNRSEAEMEAKIRRHNYDYGLQMAKAGFVTIAIDWRGFGARDDRRKPHHNDKTRPHRDQCNVQFLCAAMFGMTLLGMNIHDGQCALDHLCRQPYVDPDRIGVMGLSLGGTMTTWMAIADPRIKCADVICYSDRFAKFAIRDTNFCGSQMTPGLFDLCDVPDLQGLIAPRPLLVEIGIHDACFLVDGAMSCWHEVEKIYAAAGARDVLELDLFEGGHRWGANRSLDFFRKHLANNT